VIQEFKPAWWCRGRNAQTIVGALWRPKPRLRFIRQRIDTPDGDFLDLDFLEAAGAESGEEPLIVILHGLEGSSQAPYVLSLLGEIKRHGMAACAVNMRMCSGEPNRTLATYHSGKTEDLDCVLRYLKEKENRQRLFLAGFSIGGNIVLKWLGEQGSRASGLVEKAAAISVPYDLAQSVELLDRGFNREVYTRLLLASLKAKLRVKERLHPGATRWGLIKKCSTFRVFDREVTAPLNGFRDETDYWTKASSRPFLKDIRVPTLLIHAEDDPFFPAKLLPYEEFRKSDDLHPLIVPTGGHVGFVTGQPWRWDLWLETRTLDFLSSAIEI
jgi:predicted alpha/beta-fold hydrolase